MRSRFQGPGEGAAERAREAQTAAASLLDALRRGVAARLMPMLGDAQAAAEAELRRRLQADDGAEVAVDDVANATVLRSHLTLYERRWLDLFGRGFEPWPPPPPRLNADDAYALVSDVELQSQLVGQPVIEALERRFVDVLDIIDSRLWSLAAALGGRARPTNPIAPRALVEALLQTYPPSECSPLLRQALLRQYERLANERLVDVYGWVNTQLAEAGFAMTRAHDYAMLITASAIGAGSEAVREADAKTALWSDANALAPAESTWRDSGRPREAGAPRDATRGNLLRQRMRALRAADAEAETASPRREARSEEFLAVLSLLQGEEAALTAAHGGALAPYLRARLWQVAATLGMDRAGTRFSAAQEDAIELIGRLFDALRAGCELDRAAALALQRLACPYLRLALAEPYLFDDDEHPALAVLSEVLELWDGNDRADGGDAGLRALADEAAADLAMEYQGNVAAFRDARANLHLALEPHARRAEIAEKRVWQALQGRERLHAARRAADRALYQRLRKHLLLPTVAQFLCDQWRQSLVHAWLREGPDSERYGDAVTVGDAMIAIDEDAAQARGGAVVEGLLALERPLRDCYVACGLDDSGAQALLAAVVAELARPDAARTRHPFTPLAEDDADDADTAPDGGGAAGASPYVPGQSLLLRDAQAPPRLLRLAWISPVSGRHLLVTRQGARHLLLSRRELDAMVGDGLLTPRPLSGPVAAALQALAQE